MFRFWHRKRGEGENKSRLQRTKSKEKCRKVLARDALNKEEQILVKRHDGPSLLQLLHNARIDWGRVGDAIRADWPPLSALPLANAGTWRRKELVALIKQGAPVEYVKDYVSLHPEGAQDVDEENGSTALMVAMARNLRHRGPHIDSLVQVLLDANPRAARIASKKALFAVKIPESVLPGLAFPLRLPGSGTVIRVRCPSDIPKTRKINFLLEIPTESDNVVPVSSGKAEEDSAEFIAFRPLTGGGSFNVLAKGCQWQINPPPEAPNHAVFRFSIPKETSDCRPVSNSRNAGIPLHHAHGANVVRALVHVYPQGVVAMDWRGEIPLHAIARGDPHKNDAPFPGEEDIVNILIETAKGLDMEGFKDHGGVLTKARNGQTPLNILLERLAKRSAKFQPCPESTNVVRIMCCEAYKYLHKAEKKEKRNILVKSFHSFVEFGCPVVFFRDSLGKNDFGCDFTRRNLLTVAVMTENPSKETIMTLISDNYGCPQVAGVADFKGRYPLHWFLENDRCNDDKTVVALLSRAPLVIEARDPETHLFPFMMAAVGCSNSIDTVYRLLLMCPTLVGNNDAWMS